MKKVDLTNVKEASSHNNPLPGGYICRLVRVEDVPEKEYLKIEFDIAEGEFEGFYADACARSGYWFGSFVKSYKEKALPFFKGFITAVEKSNPTYKWDDNESTLQGRLVGVVLAEEEYVTKDGEIKTRLYVSWVHSVDEIRRNNYKLPALKELPPTTSGDFSKTPVIDELPSWC